MFKTSAKNLSIVYADEIAMGSELSKSESGRCKLIADLSELINGCIGLRADAKVLHIGPSQCLYTRELESLVGRAVSATDANTELEPESFDLVFLSNLSHTFTDLNSALSTAYRFTRRGGALVIHYEALEDILLDPEHAFFPSAAAIEVERSLSREKTENYLKDFQFRNISSLFRSYEFFVSSDERLSSAKNKALSVLQSLNELEFKIGLAKMTKHARQNPMDPWFQELTITNTWAFKP